MIAGSESRHERFSRGIVKILGFLAHSIMALILEPTFNASQTWTLIAYNTLSVNNAATMCFKDEKGLAAGIMAYRK
jgi:hypothetical protein